jgi:hypothetical protein
MVYFNHKTLIKLFQPVYRTQPIYHTVKTSPTRITASSVNTHVRNYFKSQDFNHYQLLTYIYIYNYNRNYNFNCYGVIVTQLNTFICLYSCNNDITLKMEGIMAEKLW